MSDVEYQQGRADQAAGTVDTTRTADRAYVAGLAEVRTAQVDEFLASLPSPAPAGNDGRGWASPEATAAARSDLEQRAGEHEKRADELGPGADEADREYAADLREQAAELADDTDGM